MIEEEKTSQYGKLGGLYSLIVGKALWPRMVIGRQMKVRQADRGRIAPDLNEAWSTLVFLGERKKNCVNMKKTQFKKASWMGTGQLICLLPTGTRSGRVTLPVLVSTSQHYAC